MPEQQLLSPPRAGIVVPQVRHPVEPIDEVRFYVEVLRVPETADERESGDGDGRWRDAP